MSGKPGERNINERRRFACAILTDSQERVRRWRRALTGLDNVSQALGNAFDVKDTNKNPLAGRKGGRGRCEP